MHPKDIPISAFTYALPEDRIANYPLPNRDESKLLVYRDGNISEDVYRNLAVHVPPGTLMVFNNTRVVEARLLFQKPSGGVIEIFCLEPHERYPDVATAMQLQGMVDWKCLVGGASKWKHGQILKKIVRANDSEITLEAVYKEKAAGSFVIQLSWEPRDMSFAELLHHAGAIPLPPYIKRKPEAGDEQRYQTVYAQPEGSVAAPTAGLHFTDHIFNDLAKKKIDTSFVTLHVGAGTFKPVKSATIGEHEMHSEFIDVSAKTIGQLIEIPGRNIVAVGTTSLRTIESLYWIGVKLLTDKSLLNSSHIPELQQWEPYELPGDITPAESLKNLLSWMETQKLERLVTKTSILIAPGYIPRIASGLVTNFHQPQSTLLLLIAAFVGDDWRKIYDHALENNFRFLSYGDGSLLWTATAKV